MAYSTVNYKSKKALKEAVALWNEGNIPKANLHAPRAYQPGLGPDLSNYTGRVSLEGPHYPRPHTWYAECEMKDGIIIKVM